MRRVLPEVLLSPLSKLLPLSPLLFGSLFPCSPSWTQARNWVLSCLVLLLLTTSAVFYYISRKEREPRFLLILFIVLATCGSITLFIVSFYDCSYETNTLYEGLSVSQIQSYDAGNFRCIDGEVAIEYTTVVRFYLAIETLSWTVAPIVPQLATWNQSQVVQAWAFAGASHGDEDSPPTAWLDFNTHEGILTKANNKDLYLRSAVHTAAQKNQLITPPNAPILVWGPLIEAVALSRNLVFTINFFTYGCFGLLCLISLHFHLRKLRLRDAIERDYLLDDEKPPPLYGTTSKHSFY